MTDTVVFIVDDEEGIRVVEEGKAGLDASRTEVGEGVGDGVPGDRDVGDSRGVAPGSPGRATEARSRGSRVICYASW